MARDLLLSCAALRRMPDWLPWSGEPPRLLEWPGVARSGGHSSWKAAAQELRDQDGAILPRLLARYRRFLGFDLSSVGRIAAVGFSAGSNSGIRELLRSPLDRARISFVGCIDGMHPMRATRRVHTGPESAPEPQEWYADWAGQMQPFADYALDAGADAGASMVCTASMVAPVERVAHTSEAMASLYQYVASRVAPASAWVPLAYPPRTSSPVLQPGEAYPTPDQIQGSRRFVCMWYPGTDTRAHELQAWVVVPDVLRAFLVPLWGGADPVLIGDVPETTEPPIVKAQARAAGLPNWTPVLLSAGAVAASAFA